MLHQAKFTPHFQFAGSNRFVLYLPFLSLAAVISEIVYKIVTGTNPFSSLDVNLNDLFINILLLNSLHLVFPFMILLLLPNGREFVRTKAALWSKNKIVGLSVVLVVGLLFLVSLHSTKSLDFLGPLKPLIAGSMIWVWYLVPTFHGMRQSAGVSQLLASPDIGEDLKYHQARKLERKLLRFYYGGVISAFVFQKWWAATYPPLIWIMSAISMSLAVAIIYNSRNTSATGYTDKFIFSFRFLLWPLQPYSQIVLWSVIFNHGIEYIALIQHMLRQSIDGKSARKMFIAATLFGMALISFYNVFNYIHPQYPNWAVESWAFSIFLALYPFLTLLHYAIDGIAYRMSDPDVQKTMGRFFVTPGHGR